MASYYSSEGDMLPTTYLLNQKLASYQNQTQPSASLPYPNLLSGAADHDHDHELADAHESIGRMQHIESQLNVNQDGNTVIADANTCYQGLSLSLNHYSNSNLCSLISSELNLSQNNDLKNVQYLSFDLVGKTHDHTPKYGPANNFMPIHHAPDFTGTFCNSKYLKAAQDLLDESVNVHRVVPDKVHNFNSLDQSLDMHKSNTNASQDLSPSQRHDLHNKQTKLLSMLDEVDRRYKQYCHQMQVMASSFDMVAGNGAAVPYTALALRTISRQFRCLRDAIKKQIQATQKSLGDQDVNSHGVGALSRLRYVDQQLRQQKTLQQFGVMRQPWRPQRGLPETAVSILRAWLFEHFLHPYPKDSEKIVLARQTGLSRSQVANWFINARVRLWKPMIEEMYKEEFGDAETETRSTRQISTFDDNVVESSRVGYTYENAVFKANEVNGTTGGSRVSLALGLQHVDKDSIPIDDLIQPKGNDASSSSSTTMVNLDKLECYYVDPVDNQNRFGNSHLLSDYVA